jgi:hypothetical protein
MMAETAEDGQILCILDDAGEVVAAGAYFDYEIDGSIFAELGGTVISPEFRGYGLHQMLLTLRLGGLRFLELGDEGIVFSVVKSDNVISKATVSKWLEPWDLPPVELMKMRESFSPGQEDKLFLKYSEQKDADLAKLLLEYQEINQRISRKEGQQGIQVRLDHQLITSPTLRDYLRGVVSQNK